jgi:hypothetical protein
MVEEDYLGLFRAAGSVEITPLRRFDYFAASASADTRRIVAALGAQSIEVTMRKPGSPSRAGARPRPERHRLSTDGPNMLAFREHGR